MLKVIIENFIKKNKNKDFKFDNNLTNIMLISFLWDKFISNLRSYKLYFFFKLPILNFYGKNVKFRNLSKIRLGSFVELDDYVHLNGLGKGYLIIGNKTKIGAFSRIIISSSYNNLGEYIHIGNDVGIGEYSRIGGSGGVTIGDNTIIAQYFSAHPENHKFNNLVELIKNQGTIRKKITIGENCWIGAKVTVLAGVSIGDNCVIGAGSVVTKDIPSNNTAVGIPAKILKERA